MLLDKQQHNNIVKLDEGYYIFCTIRNSPAYFETKKKDVMAMVYQLGIPTIFARCQQQTQSGQTYSYHWESYFTMLLIQNQILKA